MISSQGGRGIWRVACAPQGSGAVEVSSTVQQPVQTVVLDITVFYFLPCKGNLVSNR